MNSEKLLPNRLLIIGCGDIGLRLAKALPRNDYLITGVRRSPPASTHEQVIYHAGDVTKADALNQLEDEEFRFIVITMTPAERSDEAYRLAYVQTCVNLIANLKNRRLKPELIIFVSSTGVYGQTGGEWVDEQSPTLPESYSGKRLLEAEGVIRGSGFPACIVRFSGIYGPGRTRLIDQVRQGKGVLSASYTNRIHADDCAGFLAHLIQSHRQGAALEPVYVASDSEPAPMAEVVNWLSMQLKVDKAIFAPAPDLERANKRCRNRQLIASGYSLRYPNYREGYGILLQDLAAG